MNEGNADIAGNITRQGLVGTATVTPGVITTRPIDTDELIRYIRKVAAPKLAKEFKQNPDDLEQDFWLNLYQEGLTLDDLDYPKAYAYQAIRNDCINKGRHTKVVIAFADRSECESVNSKRNGGRVVVSSATAPSREDEMIQREEQLLRRELLAQRKADLRQSAQKVFTSLDEFETQVVDLWLQHSVAEIAQATGKSLATIHRITKKIQKAIVAEFGTVNVSKAVFVAGIRESIANSARGRG